MNIAEKVRAHRARARTTDSRRVSVQERFFTTDAILSADPGRLNPDMMGRAWTGASLAQAATTMIRDMTRDAQVSAVRQMRDALDDLETEFASDESVHRGAGRTPTGDRLGTDATPASINRAWARHISERLQRPVDRVAQARDHRFARNGRVSVADIGAANKKFWKG